MEAFLYISSGIIGLAILYYGAEWLVKGSSSLARKAGVSQLVIGLTFVAFATSAPELVVSVSAALDNNPGISLGNIIGSNTCNIALILGICACITPLEVKKQLLKFDAPVMCASALLLTLLYLVTDGLARWHGIIFLAGIIAYTWLLVAASRRETSCKKNTSGEIPSPAPENVIKALLLAAAGLGALIYGAKLLLASSVYLARLVHLSETVIGLTVVAVGTSLPELATSVVSAIKGEKDIAVGNIIGSNIFNILGILGITPLIMPLKNARIDTVDLGAMLLCSFLLLPMMRSGFRISRKEGIVLLMIYAAYTTYLIFSHA